MLKRMMTVSTRACHQHQECSFVCEEKVLQYHEATKHSFKRRYDGIQLARLDHLSPQESDQPYPLAFQHHLHSPKPLNKRTLSQLLFDSLALSAWKTTGVSTWSLRVNPSSGNLHPTEGYVISGPVTGICSSPFVAHYAPKEHALEIRAQLTSTIWSELSAGCPADCVFVAFSSIFWREAWKYGERAFRYCNHDVGHAIAAVAVSAANLGWRSMLLDSWGFDELRLLLGLPTHGSASTTSAHGVAKGHFTDLEQEHGDCIMVLFPANTTQSISNLSPSKELISHLSRLTWTGTPNALSREHVRWDIIYQVAEATKKPSFPHNGTRLLEGESAHTSSSADGDMYGSVYDKSTIRHVVRTRRSAVSMDGRHVMKRDAFYQMLLKTMPALAMRPQLPFSVLPWASEIDMVLFVHRVADLSPGLYLLIRNPSHHQALRTALRPEFEWKKPPDCPSQLPLYLLATGDCRVISERLSCHQEIASDGCFSLGMLARFEDTIRNHGAWMYPRLFWEAGALGHLLYLEAHAVGISATGIGCYFDDGVHQLLGIKDTKFQSLYHFTVGAPVLDKRIMSLPAYPGPSGDHF